MTMLEFTKIVLEKVSFSPQLFRKELRKALRKCSSEDFRSLMNWCRTQFGSKKKMNSPYNQI
jgi:hypothetical protein